MPQANIGLRMSPRMESCTKVLMVLTTTGDASSSL